MISVSQVSYKNYGKCQRISNGNIEILVTTEIGPRIIFAGLVGGENIMYEDEKELITKSDSQYFDPIGKGIWHIYGGHRLWKSPEDIDSYYPDNSPVNVKILENGAIFTADIEVTNKLQKSMQITMDDNNNVEILHSFTNCGDTTSPKVALWGLNVLDKGAKAVIPLSTKDTGLLANRNLVLWSYTDIKDSRLDLQQDKITLTWDNKPPMKIGAIIQEPISVFTKGLKFTVESQYDPQAEYADFSCNTEFYTNTIMMEIETLSSLEAIKAGETKTHLEKWSLNKI